MLIGVTCIVRKVLEIATSPPFSAAPRNDILVRFYVYILLQ